MNASSQPSQMADLASAWWTAHALTTSVTRVLPTGDAALDAQLPGGGWPLGCMIEVLQADTVHAEWRLLLPALARSGQGLVVLVGAPHVPFAPALQAQGLKASRLLWVQTSLLRHRLWAAEQALSCAQVDAVLLWLSGAQDAAAIPRRDHLKRLQLAAAQHAKLLFVVRAARASDGVSPAPLRLELRMPGATVDGSTGSWKHFSDLHVHVRKRRGPPLDRALGLRAYSTALDSLVAIHQQGAACSVQASVDGQHALDRSVPCA